MCAQVAPAPGWRVGVLARNTASAWEPHGMAIFGQVRL
jgi:uncharacterized protein YcnI